MRVTQNMVSANILKNISNSYQQMSVSQQQLSSGKKITLPSDDPVVASQGIAYRTDVAQVTQYQRNIDRANEWTSSADSALSETNDVLQRIRELAVQGSTGTTTSSDQQSIKDEIDQLKQQLVTVANTQVGGEYIFNGTNTGQAPASINSNGTVTINSQNAQVDSAGNVTATASTGSTTNSSDKVYVQANQGVNLQINVSPTAVFNSSLFSTISKLETNLTNGADSNTISQSISDLDNQISNLSAAQSDLGARENRITMITNRLSDQQQTATTIMSNNEDADMAQTMVNYEQQQAVYTAALSVGAKVMQPTLVDYLS